MKFLILFARRHMILYTIGLTVFDLALIVAVCSIMRFIYYQYLGLNKKKSIEIKKYNHSFIKQCISDNYNIYRYKISQQDKVKKAAIVIFIGSLILLQIWGTICILIGRQIDTIPIITNVLVLLGMIAILLIVIFFIILIKKLINSIVSRCNLPRSTKMRIRKAR